MQGKNRENPFKRFLHFREQFTLLKSPAGEEGVRLVEKGHSKKIIIRKKGMSTPPIASTASR